MRRWRYIEDNLRQQGHRQADGQDADTLAAMVADRQTEGDDGVDGVILILPRVEPCRPAGTHGFRKPVLLGIRNVDGLVGRYQLWRVVLLTVNVGHEQLVAGEVVGFEGNDTPRDVRVVLH